MKKAKSISLVMISAIVLLTMIIVVPTTMAAEISKISTGATSGTTGDCTWSYNETTKTITISGSGAMEDYDNITPWHSLKGEINTIVIKDGVTYIGGCTFINCNSTTKISIPKSVKKVGNSAFAGCKSLKNIAIPNSITEIQGAVFYGCYSLVDIILPNGITTIWSQTFENCENLKSITIPKSVTLIKDSAFNNCTNLKNIYYNGLKEDWSKISIANNNMPLTNAIIHYGKKNQSITAKSFTKLYGAKAFKINAKTSGDGKLSYKTSNKKIVTVSSKGKITTKGCGKATITIKAAETLNYKKTSKKITITVKPSKVKIKYFKGNKKSLKIFYNKQNNADGYQCIYNRGKKLIKTTSKQHFVKLKNLKKGICIAKIRAYKRISGKIVYGKYGKYQLTIA